MQRQQKTQDEIEQEWKGFTYAQRRKRWDHARQKQRTLEAAQAAVAAGTASLRTASYATRGGYRHHATLELGHQISLKENNRRVSEDRLQFRLKHATGCVFPGCPLGPQEGSEVLFTLLEHGHIDPTKKKGVVTAMKGLAREQELLKTRCLCIWHHCVHVREVRLSSNGKRTVKVADDRRLLQQTKQVNRCEHPLHASMPYASLVDADHPVYVGFLDISHVRRGLTTTCMRGMTPRAATAIELLLDHRNEKASVHCKFCHKLYTLCEDAMLSDAPLTQQQYALLLKKHPAFVQHFHEQTNGFDWAAERQRISTVCAEGQKKGTKRKRENA